MNYRHAFHAGNFADVVKHIVLTLTIEQLKKKSKPMRVIDTHAGCGLYDLHSAEALRTNEWRNGIGRLLEASNADPGFLQCHSLQSYLGVIRAINGDSDLRSYPGSPLIARELLRPDDKLIVNELHPEDVKTLRSQFTRRDNTKVTCLDAWVFLKSVLPPPERRGIILVDPPFEQPGEFERMVQGLRAATKRFATGVYLLWYPLKHPREVAQFKQQLRDSGLRRLLAVEVFIARQDKDSGFVGTGLILHNPPFGLQDELSNILPKLTNLLADSTGGSFACDELVGE